MSKYGRTIEEIQARVQNLDKQGIIDEWIVKTQKYSVADLVLSAITLCVQVVTDNPGDEKVAYASTVATRDLILQIIEVKKNAGH
jgi:hypothetical protein